jgi:hypothetical protein
MLNTCFSLGQCRYRGCHYNRLAAYILDNVNKTDIVCTFTLTTTCKTNKFLVYNQWKYVEIIHIVYY